MPRKGSLTKLLEEVAALNAAAAAKKHKVHAPHVATEAHDEELCRHLFPHLQHRVLHPQPRRVSG